MINLYPKICMFRLLVALGSILCPISIYAQAAINAYYFPEGASNIYLSIDWDTIPACYFTQMEPQKGSPSLHPTKFVVYSDFQNLYIAVRCYQPSESIVASIQSRDNFTKNDDAIALIFDTYNDGQTSQGFYVNPLGTQVDFKIADDGRTEDINWDTQWESIGHKVADGWLAYLKIPFQSLAFNSHLTTWGFNIARIIRYKSETAYWSGALNSDFRVSQGGKLNGLVVPQTKSRLSAFPYVTSSLENNSQEGYWFKSRTQIGGDIRLGLFSSTRVDATINPDFATVEGDKEQINLTKYELSFPEKRLFFQEGNEMFNTRIQTFYSRRIGDIEYGAKVSGKQGPVAFNILSVKGDRNQQSDTLGAVYSVGRAKADIFKSSNVGFTIADKSWAGGFTRSFSTDFVLNPGDAWKITGQFVASLPADRWNATGGFLRVAHESNIHHIHFRYTSLGTSFQENVNQTGFIVDDDRNEFDSDISYTWWFKEQKIFKYLTFISKNNIFWSHQQLLRSWDFSDQLALVLHNRLSLNVLYKNSYKLYDKSYYNYYWLGAIGYNVEEWNMVQSIARVGRNFDQQFYWINLQGRIKATSKLSLEMESNFIRYVPDEITHSFVNIATVQYNFTKDLWIQVFAQNNTENQRIYVYGKAGYRFKPPFGAVYLVYSRNDEFLPDEHVDFNQEIWYVKFTYPINAGK